MQFSLRTLLGAITYAATAFAFWPHADRGPETAHYLLIALTTLLACSFLLTDAAWRRANQRASQLKTTLLNREKLALALTIGGILPFAALWLFGFIEPYEASGRVMSWLVRCLGYLIGVSYFPATLCIVASFKVFFGAGRNPPLMALRVIWGSMCIAVPLFVYYFILPRLG